MKLILRIWRQKDREAQGRFETYEPSGLSSDMSVPEMLDALNEQLLEEGRDPVAFDSDCREGICGTCGVMINGRAHGKQRGTTACELRLRHFHDGQTVTLEPFRAKAFPVVKDLMIDRSALDEIIMAGGYVSVNTGAAPDANALPVAKENAETAMDAAACIGCGACAAACPNAAAMLFVGAKISHLSLLPQGRVEWQRRALNMTAAMDKAGFGNCSNHGECEATCPKELKLTHIARLNRQHLFASLFGVKEKENSGGL